MADSRTKSARIRDTLRHRLRAGHVRPGARFYSNNTLAEDFGVSAPTASKILDQLCAEGLVHRVHGSGTYVSETAIEPALRPLAVLMQIELPHPLVTNTVIYDIIRRLESICASHGWRSDLVNVDDVDYLETFDELLAGGLAGLLVMPPFAHPGIAAVLAKLPRHPPMPIVYWGSPDDAPTPDYPGDRVAFDEEQTGNQATEHLLALGHRHIAFVGYAEEFAWQRQRRDGWRAALRAADVTPGPDAVHRVAKTAMSPSVLTAMLRDVFAAGHTGIVAANDTLATEIVLAGRAIGCRCPADFSIVGVDNRREAMLNHLTTIDQSADSFARLAFELLTEPAPVPRLRRAGVQLIVRRTTGVPPAATTR